MFETIVKVASYAYDTSFNPYDNITKTILDSLIAILLACFVKSSLDDLYTFLVGELELLRDNQTLSRRTTKIIPHTEFRLVYKKIKDLIAKRTEIAGNIAMGTAITIKPDAINKQIHSLAVMFGGSGEKSYGLRTFNKLPKNILIPMITTDSTTVVV